MSEQRCKFADPKHGGHHCGSYAFNLASKGIKQGEFCDTHYWQTRCEKAEATLATQPQAPQGGGWQPIETASEDLQDVNVLLSGKFGVHISKIFKYSDGDIVVVIAHIAGNSVEGISHCMAIPAVPAPTETPEAGK